MKEVIRMPKDISSVRQEVTAPQVIPLRIEDGWVSLDQHLLPEIWLDEPIEAVVRSYGILIKPRSLSQQTRGGPETFVVQRIG
jgi:hypothetical protein